MQLAEEGAVQLFRPLGTSDYVLGAVGMLQFEVTSARLKNEYGAETSFEPVPYTVARWADCDDRKRLKNFEQQNSSFLACDTEGHLTFLAPSEWRLENTMKEWPEIHFYKTRENN